MRILGIDYGSKRIGLATSDEGGRLAFPYMVLENNEDFFEKMKKILVEEKIETIVVGESKSFSGEENKIMKEITPFVERIKKEINITVFFEPEFLSSFQAERFQGKHDLLDASAAAIILQSFLDRSNNV